MERTPVMMFESFNHAMSLLRDWQNKMFLNDWIIHLKIIPFTAPPLDGLYMGHSDADHVNNCAMIYLADQTTLPQDALMTLCDEKVLVHELLHLIYPTFVNAEEFTSAYMDTEEHRKLEKMAKTLILAKYDLPREWFDRHWHDKNVKGVTADVQHRNVPRREEVAQTE